MRAYPIELVLLGLEQVDSRISLTNVSELGVDCGTHLLAVICQEIISRARVFGCSHLELNGMTIGLVEPWVLLRQLDY